MNIGWALVIFMVILFLCALWLIFQLHRSEESRAKQSVRNLAIMHKTGHRPPHTKWDGDGYLIDD